MFLISDWALLFWTIFGLCLIIIIKYNIKLIHYDSKQCWIVCRRIIHIYRLSYIAVVYVWVLSKDHKWNWSKCKTNSRISHLRPRSFFKVPPYFGLVPIKSMISGIQLAKIAYSQTNKHLHNFLRHYTKRHSDYVLHNLKNKCILYYNAHILLMLTSHNVINLRFMCSINLWACQSKLMQEATFYCDKIKWTVTHHFLKILV